MLGKDLNTVPNVWSSIRAGRTSRLHWNEWFNGRPRKKSYFGQRRSPPVALILQTGKWVPGGQGPYFSFSFRAHSPPWRPCDWLRGQSLSFHTPTLVNVQGFSCCSQSLGTLFLARLSCVLSSLHVLFFLKGVSRPLPYPGRCPTCHIGRYKSQPFNYQS